MRAEIEKKMKETADYIFRHPEISEQEVQSSALWQRSLRKRDLRSAGESPDLRRRFLPSGDRENRSSDSLQSMMRFREWGRRCAAQEGLRAVRGMDAATTCWAQRVQALPVL